MEPEYISFEEIDREKRADRLRDAERLRKGEITPEALQEENSIIPKGARVIFDIVEYANRVYLKK